MNQKELQQLPINDLYQQCMRKLRRLNEDIRLQRKEEIINCNHLFLMLKNGEHIYAQNSTDCCYNPNIVECVHCGLTNKYMDLEEILSHRKYDFTYSLPFLGVGSKYQHETLESEIFREIFKNAYRRGGKSFDESVINLIIDEALYTNHPRLLYQLALIIKPNANQEELFEIMKELESLETLTEKIRLQDIQQATELLSRYYDNKPKIKTYTNNK